MRAVTVAVGLAALGALGGAGCSRDRAAPNLLFITLDTVRADRLGCYGAAGAETGTLDRLAREGAAVETSIAVAPLIRPLTRSPSSPSHLWPGARAAS